MGATLIDPGNPPADSIKPGTAVMTALSATVPAAAAAGVATRDAMEYGSGGLHGWIKHAANLTGIMFAFIACMVVYSGWREEQREERAWRRGEQREQTAEIVAELKTMGATIERRTTADEANRAELRAAAAEMRSARVAIDALARDVRALVAKMPDPPGAAADPGEAYGPDGCEQAPPPRELSGR